MKAVQIRGSLARAKTDLPAISGVVNTATGTTAIITNTATDLFAGAYPLYSGECTLL